jgi:hypothetical protein
VSRGEPLVVFVGGTARSGSTVLDLMLGGTPDRFSCGEVAAWFRPWRPYHLDLACRCGERPCPVWIELADLRARSFHCGAAERLGVEVVVDSSKSLSWISDSRRWIARCAPDPVVVLVWKEPRDLAHSFYRRSPNDDAVLTALRNFVGYYSMAMSLPIKTVAVRNDALRNHPANTVRSLSETLGIAYDDGQERFWERTHHHLFGSDSATTQVRSGTQEVDPPTDLAFDHSWARLEPRLDGAVRDVRRALESLDHSRSNDPTMQRPTGMTFTRRRHVQQRMLGHLRTATLVARHPHTAIHRYRAPASTRRPR